MRRILIVLLVIAGTPAAYAQPIESPFLDPVTMDPLTPESAIGFDFGYEVWDLPGDTDFSVMGITLGGRFVDQRSGFGGYVTLPLSYVSLDGNFFGIDINESSLMLGNIEGGAMFTKWFNPDVAMIFHGGIALPTADDEDELFGLQDLANSPRYSEFVLRDPNTTWLRLGLSPMGRSGTFLWRADVGIDLAINDDNPDNFQYSPVLHLSVGAGVDLGNAVLQAELVNLVLDNPQGDDSSSTLSLGARFGAGRTTPGIALILPLGFDGDSDNMEFGVAASITARL
jgi:hypothetical protein